MARQRGAVRGVTLSESSQRRLSASVCEEKGVPNGTPFFLMTLATRLVYLGFRKINVMFRKPFMTFKHIVPVHEW